MSFNHVMFALKYVLYCFWLFAAYGTDICFCSIPSFFPSHRWPLSVYSLSHTVLFVSATHLTFFAKTCPVHMGEEGFRYFPRFGTLFLCFMAHFILLYFGFKHVGDSCELIRYGNLLLWIMWNHLNMCRARLFGIVEVLTYIFIALHIDFCLNCQFVIFIQVVEISHVQK